MKILTRLVIGTVLVAAGGYCIRVFARPDDLQAVAVEMGSKWTASFRNVSQHQFEGKTWLCGEVTKSQMNGYERFVILKGGNAAALEQSVPDLFETIWAKYCP